VGRCGEGLPRHSEEAQRQGTTATILYNAVTLLSHGCHALSHCDHTVVTLLSHTCCTLTHLGRIRQAVPGQSCATESHGGAQEQDRRQPSQGISPLPHHCTPM
jgi:hypothetical protein